MTKFLLTPIFLLKFSIFFNISMKFNQPLELFIMKLSWEVKIQKTCHDIFSFKENSMTRKKLLKGHVPP